MEQRRIIQVHPTQVIDELKIIVCLSSEFLMTWYICLIAVFNLKAYFIIDSVIVASFVMCFHLQPTS
jgi:hypothetical protein